jgi:hypothetical protein
MILFPKKTIHHCRADVGCEICGCKLIEKVNTITGEFFLVCNLCKKTRSYTYEELNKMIGGDKDDIS